VFGQHINNPGKEIADELYGVYKSDTEEGKALESVLTSKYILFDFQQETIIPSCVESLEEYLSLVLWKKLSRSLGKREGVIEKEWVKAGKPHIGDIAWYLKEEWKKPLLIHFDEVGAIENHKFNRFFNDPPTPEIALKDLPHLNRYYDLWRELLPLFRMKDVHVYCSGKSVAFSLIGLGLLQRYDTMSPTSSEHIILGSLEVNHIIETMDATMVQGVSISESLGLVTHEMKEKFAKIFHEQSAGIPRLVRYGLFGAWLSGFNFGEMDEETLRNKITDQRESVTREMLKAPGLRAAMGVYLPEKLRSILEVLLFFSFANLPISKNLRIPVYDEDLSMPLIHFVDACQCYITSVQKPKIMGEKSKGTEKRTCFKLRQLFCSNDLLLSL